MTEFDEDEVAAAGRALTRVGRVTFGALCCERLVPNYDAFTRETGWGQPVLLRDALDAVWRWLCAEDADERSTQGYIAKVERITPDTEKFETHRVSSALDAATSVAALLELVADDDVEHVVEIASAARDTIDMFVQELESMDPDDPRLEQKIADHPLMKRELEVQRADLSLVRSLTAPGQPELLSLRSTRVPGESSIRIGPP